MSEIWKWFGITLIVSFGSFTPVPAVSIGVPDQQSDDIHIRCKLSYGRFACDAYARRSGATAFSKPDKNAKVLKQKQFGHWLGTLRPASEVSGDEWLAVYVVVDGPTGPGTRAITAYVPRSQVILDTDFRKVTGCWPVKHFIDPEGGSDYHPGEVYFTVDGIASYPHHPVTGQEFGEQETYYAEGIFTVRHKRYLNRGYVGHAVLDYANRSITATSGKPLKGPEHVQWFSPDELKGCKEIPTVDPNSRAPNPKDYRDGGG